MKRHILACLLVLASCAALAQDVESLADDTVVIEGTGAARGTRVVFVTKSVASSEIYPDAKPGQFPRNVRIITALSIAVKGKPIFVSRSVFADLAFVHYAELRRNLLIIQAGDASESRNARISFDDLRVLRRSIYVGTDEKDLLERTTYHKVVYE